MSGSDKRADLRVFISGSRSPQKNPSRLRSVAETLSSPGLSLAATGARVSLASPCCSWTRGGSYLLKEFVVVVLFVCAVLWSGQIDSSVVSPKTIISATLWNPHRRPMSALASSDRRSSNEGALKHLASRGAR